MKYKLEEKVYFMHKNIINCRTIIGRRECFTDSSKLEISKSYYLENRTSEISEEHLFASSQEIINHLENTVKVEYET